MKPMTLAELALLSGARIVGDAGIVVADVVTDTRKLAADAAPGAELAPRLFVALQGANFDGHDHIAEAVQRGAVAVLVEREVDVPVAQLVVENCERALADIARGLQARRAGKLFAITGSNGKTSVKTLLLSILQQAGAAYANPGNFNNEIGLPLAVIQAPDDADFYIYEMGAGKPGDIAWLTAIARPDISVVNNIAAAHLERMGSLLAIADTKAAVYDDLSDAGTAVINADEVYAPYFEARAGRHRVLRYALEASADVSASAITLTAEGSQFRLHTSAADADITLAFAGRHNIANAVAAAAMALAAGVDIADIRAGLQAARPVAGRLLLRQLGNGAQLIDDSYNANPGSLRAAIDTLAASGGESWLVLGDMRELGADEMALHAEVGQQAKAAGIARLYALGSLSAHAAAAFGDGAQSFTDHATLAESLRAELHAGVRVLVKGSRGSAMDRVASALLEGEDADAA
ncbi:MAG: UDP-N-acetylmuramoyl-tripeptide--D-alanyl-D-alanine ligase [Pseudomonadota bacterium]|nr:UDP-N-acetylmuramoyl-tripeptide--D-alanyl-D-alanine ligase [Pseudomonadota bacterium]